MLRLLHTADVHLGARHADLGTQAAAQRERQFDAFRATVDLALAEKVDAVLIAGDLFDSNTQPRRSVERVAAEFKRLVDARIRTFIVPGTHDVYDRSSIYRAYDLPAMAGAVDRDLVTVLTPEQGDVHVQALDAVVHGRCFETKRAPTSPLSGLDAAADDRATWHIGLVHGALAIPDRTDADDVVFTKEEIAASGLDYLALGHWHSTQQGKAGGTTYAYSGSPEPVAIDQDRAGSVLVISLDERDGKKTVTVEPKKVGRTRFEHLDVDAAQVATQPAVIDVLNKKADKDLVLDVRLIGVRPDSLDLDVDEVTNALGGKFLKLRLRDQSTPPLTEGPIPSAETILGAFIRDTEAKIAELEATEDPAAAEWRDVLRLGRLLLSGAEVTL
ncbi:MAG: DNA repair exonuclease [Chloroflexi bacterium]|nr:DNA repair exonuclease [Chloroflexota bacterium]